MGAKAYAARRLYQISPVTCMWLTAASNAQNMSLFTLIAKAEPDLETHSDQSHPILHTLCYTWEVRCVRYFLHGR